MYRQLKVSVRCICTRPERGVCDRPSAAARKSDGEQHPLSPEAFVPLAMQCGNAQSMAVRSLGAQTLAAVAPLGDSALVKRLLSQLPAASAPVRNQNLVSCRLPSLSATGAAWMISLMCHIDKIFSSEHISARLSSVVNTVVFMTLKNWDDRILCHRLKVMSKFCLHPVFELHGCLTTWELDIR